MTYLLSVLYDAFIKANQIMQIKQTRQIRQSLAHCSRCCLARFKMEELL